MKWYSMISFYIIPYYLILLFPSTAFPNNNPLNLIIPRPYTITIIGETHQKPESSKFFFNLVANHIQQNKCLVVGLEIPSNQQPVIEKIEQGRATAFDLNIPPIIDHPAFRKMIDDLAKLKQNGSCIKLFAVDADNDTEIRRDKWIAKQLAVQVGNAPVIALLGSLHTLKRLNWDKSMTPGKPYAAEILLLQGYDVKTYPQEWSAEQCFYHEYFWNHYIYPDTQDALDLLNYSLVSLLNAFEFKAAAGVVDGFIVWECVS